MQTFDSIFPANAYFMLGKLIFIANFEVIPNNYADHFFKFKDTEPLSDRFMLSSYESMNPLQNASTDVLTIQILALVLLVCLVTYAFVHTHVLCKRTLIFLSGRLFWTFPLRYFFEGYLEFCITFFIGLEALEISLDSIARL